MDLRPGFTRKQDAKWVATVIDAAPRSWQVGALCRAIADALEARFNPVTVTGEVSGFTRASSGHCYFSLKDSSAQIRCVMFKRASGMLDFSPRDGQMVELRGRVSLYEPRGDLQLMVESMRLAGAGALFEQFLRLKVTLENEGLFDAVRKRPLPLMPRGIGVVTSAGAAALRDVATTLQRRAPHVPVVISAGPVQGAGAPAALVQALERLYALAQPPSGRALQAVLPVIDVILVVRGGGSIEDLWAFNDEILARTIARSPVPVISGVGHETDFTIADFVADIRAPTPTAAAELAATARDVWLATLDNIAGRLRELVWRSVDVASQRTDSVAARLVRPSMMAAAQRFALVSFEQRMRHATRHLLGQHDQKLLRLRQQLAAQLPLAFERHYSRLSLAQMQLSLLDPALVLQRGYAWLVADDGQTITSAAQTTTGQHLRASLASGTLDLIVSEPN